MRDLRRPLAFTVLDRYCSQALSIATLVVMARVLTPAETGLFLVASSIVLLAEAFRDFGVGSFLIQAQDADRQSVRAAFTVCAALSIGCGIAVVAAAEPLARVYGEAELARLLLVGAIGFLIVPFGTPATALLRRELRFGAVAGINVTAALVTAGSTIGLGLLGLGPVSYVWGSVLGNAAATVIAVALGPGLWMFRPVASGLGKVVRFGTVSTAVTLLNMAYDLLPRLLLGRILGLDPLAILSRAQGLCQLADRALTAAAAPLVLPAFALRARTTGELAGALLSGHAFMSALQWPALATLALLAEPIVAVVLGPQWHAAAPLVRIVAFAGIVLTPGFMAFPLLVAIGRVRETLIASLIYVPISIALVAAAAWHGLEAVAVAFVVAAFVQAGVVGAFVLRATGCRLADLLRASADSALVTLAAAAGPAAIVAASGHAPVGIPAGAVALALAGLGWLAGIWLTGHPLRAEIARAARRAGITLRSRAARPAARSRAVGG